MISTTPYMIKSENQNFSPTFLLNFSAEQNKSLKAKTTDY
jgi:hypothetical protein